MSGSLAQSGTWTEFLKCVHSAKFKNLKTVFELKVFYLVFIVTGQVENARDINACKHDEELPVTEDTLMQYL